MRFKPRTLIAVICLLLTVIAGQWFYFKAQFDKALPTLEGRARAAGLDIDYDARTIHGFPFRLEARYKNITIGKTDPLLSFAIKAKQAVLIRQLLRKDLSLLYFEAPNFAAAAEGPMPGGQTGEHVMAWTAPAMQTSLRSVDGNIARLSAVIDLPEGTTTVAGIEEFAAKQMQFHLNWLEQGRKAAQGTLAPRLIINAQATALDLKDAGTAPLSSTLAKVQIGATLHLADYYALETAGLQQWQRDKGFLALTQFDLSWDDFTIGQSKGALRLDDALRPKGNAQLTVTGLPALTYAIDKTDVLGAQEDFALLTLRLARAGGTGETPTPLDFEIDRGIVRLGPAPLVLLGPVAALDFNER